MLILYSLALATVLVLGAPWWLFRMATSGKYREGLTERLGFLPQRILGSLHGRKVVWIHAVSVGELLAASRLIEELDARLAASAGRRATDAWQVMISTTTRTGQQLARQRFGAERVFYFPLDLGFAVRAWLRPLRPQLFVLLETEFWPRMLAECRKQGIPVAVVNARISDRSWPRYRALRWMWRPVLRALGVENVRVAGNLKYDVHTAGEGPLTALLRQWLPEGARVLVCGSTLGDEEELLLEARPADAVTILAPRHPERFGDVAELLRRRGVPFVRRSEWVAAPTPLAPGSVFLLDSIGELAPVYSLATAAFIGGSLVARGGHNPLEAAQFGVPVAMGPSYENFRGIVEKLQGNDAIRIVQPAELKSVLAEMLSGSAESRVASRAVGLRAREVFAREAGATGRAVEALLGLLRRDGVNAEPLAPHPAEHEEARS